MRASVSQADTNGDGMIGYDEFLQYFHNHEPHVEAGSKAVIQRPQHQSCDMLKHLMVISGQGAEVQEDARTSSIAWVLRVQHR